MAKVSFVASSATTYDLTDASVNPHAVTAQTVREEGTIIHNRFVWAGITAPTLTNKVMNVLKLLEVPPRTMLTGDIWLVSPPATAGCTHNVNSKSVESATVGIGAIIYRSASQSAVVASMTAAFAKATLAKSKIHTSSILALPADPETSGAAAVRKVVANVAGGNQGWADGGVDGQVGVFFPYGGWVTLQILAGKGASGVADSSLDAAFVGAMDIYAQAFKVPEG
jgi:hypothetical protein